MRNRGFIVTIGKRRELLIGAIITTVADYLEHGTEIQRKAKKPYVI